MEMNKWMNQSTSNHTIYQMKRKLKGNNNYNTKANSFLREQNQTGKKTYLPSMRTPSWFGLQPPRGERRCGISLARRCMIFVEGCFCQTSWTQLLSALQTERLDEGFIVMILYQLNDLHFFLLGQKYSLEVGINWMKATCRKNFASFERIILNNLLIIKLSTSTCHYW